MTRKDYELIAAALKRARPTQSIAPAKYQGWENAVISLADDIGETYMNFQRERFLRAAGVES
jgi:hypothetical protein